MFLLTVFFSSNTAISMADLEVVGSAMTSATCPCSGLKCYAQNVLVLLSQHVKMVSAFHCRCCNIPGVFPDTRTLNTLSVTSLDCTTLEAGERLTL